MATARKIDPRPAIDEREASSASRSARPRAIKASLEHALLGMIAEFGAVSGYDLIKIFRVSMVHFWHAHQGQIYPTLERMERAGLIRSREVLQHGRPNKRLFSITPEGRRMLVEWLHSPYEEVKVKYPPLLRMRFLGHLGYQGSRAKLMEQREQLEKMLRTFLALKREYFGDPPHYATVDMMFSYFTLRSGIRTLESNLEMCEWGIAEIDRNRALFEARGKRGIQLRAERRRKDPRSM
jgi:DNA-binding PadR family transcriptional regulator